MRIINKFIPAEIKLNIKQKIRSTVILLLPILLRKIPINYNSKTSKKHIAFVLHIGNFGGIETVILSLIKELKKDGYTFTLLYTMMFDNSEILEDFKELKINCIYLGKTYSSTFNWLQQMILLFKTIAQSDFSVICFNNFPYGFEIIPYIKEKKKIIYSTWVHGLLPGEFNIKLLSKKNYLFNHIFVTNNYLRSFFINNHVTHVSVLYTGIDKKQNKIISRQAARKKLKLPKDLFICSFIGRLVEDKNPLFLINIANACKDKKNIFNIVGSGSLENKIKSKIKEYNLEKTVVLQGFKKNVSEYLAASNILIMTSCSYEGCPLVLLEAMAQKVPVVISDFPGANDLFTNNVQGYILPLDTTNFYDAIITLQNNKKIYKQMQKASESLVKKRYLINITSKNFLKTLHL
jgi:glycosyltransferase involved in cell wall biosynthesis